MEYGFEIRSKTLETIAFFSFEFCFEKKNPQVLGASAAVSHVGIFFHTTTVNLKWSNGIHTEASKRQKNGLKFDIAFQRILSSSPS